jgi:Ca2+-binding RTX toxin-like protein
LADENDDTVLRVGFEDLPYLGDADFDDIVFNMRIEDRVILTPGVDDDDILIGGAGNDTMYGGFGDDILVFGNGADHLYGGFGSDILLMNYLDALVDTIHDFELGAGRDVLNITNILHGFDPMASAIEDFIQLVSSGPDHHLLINANGAGAFVHAITFAGGLGAGVDLDTLLAQGNLVVDQSVIY